MGLAAKGVLRSRKPIGLLKPNLDIDGATLGEDDGDNVDNEDSNDE